MKSSERHRLIVVMGVSGCGKTTVGTMLSEETGIPFFDADDFHPGRNVEKMRQGRPLTDEDRMPWLEVLSRKLSQWESEKGAILACSALKESYRQRLSAGTGDILWVYLKGSYELIARRMDSREGHYMGSGLLESQFQTLEAPDYGLHLEIDQAPRELVKKIKQYLMDQNKSEFGVYGLGVMGSSISLNIADKGFALSVFNRSEGDEAGVVTDFLEQNSTYENIRGYTGLEEFVNSLERPRKILLMIKAGPAVDLVLDSLLPLLCEGDIVIDGGNSFYRNTVQRCDRAAGSKVGFIGCGISGGEQGARKGPSIMPGGRGEDYEKVREVLEAIAARDRKGRPCCAYVGPGGAGHFVKMVHNGIEYVEMQLLAEIYAMLRARMANEEIAALFEQWNSGRLESYLLGITAQILRKKEGQNFLVDLVLDRAGNKGTGLWSSREALEMGVPVTMMSGSVFARYISSFKEERVRNAASFKTGVEQAPPSNLEMVKKAYEFSRWINHIQGFLLMEQASENYGWALDFNNLTRIWSGGCIIQSRLMSELEDLFGNTGKVPPLSALDGVLMPGEPALASLLQLGVKQRVPLPCFYAAYQYYVSMTTADLPANLIQAQRDYFGAHTFQRKDDATGKYYHAQW